MVLDREFEDLVRAGRRLIVIDGRVVDVADFLRRHPGGEAVLLANIGRDASADFQHVGAHRLGAVERALSRLVVARFNRALPAQGVAGLLDHLGLVRNSFEVSRDDTRPVELELVYVAQSFAHLITGHTDGFRAVLAQFCGDARHPGGTERSVTAELMRLVVERSLASGDPHTAGVLVTHMRRSARALTDRLAALVGGRGQATGREHARTGLAWVEEWSSGEYDYWRAFDA